MQRRTLRLGTHMSNCLLGKPARKSSRLPDACTASVGVAGSGRKNQPIAKSGNPNSQNHWIQFSIVQKSKTRFKNLPNLEHCLVERKHHHSKISVCRLLSKKSTGAWLMCAVCFLPADGCCEGPGGTPTGGARHRGHHGHQEPQRPQVLPELLQRNSVRVQTCQVIGHHGSGLGQGQCHGKTTFLFRI